ncbi:choice-of-anchor M domain-containing protein [Streptomyces sp. NPDC052023]|uniref:choice-of-anchor M domain-containing protein n=1 Tax=Streptomyces sp. NPDC052023 TaxID=3365681 RepID=UPI0037D50B94
MTSHQSARWAIVGAVGSVALAAGLSPVAFADAGDNGVQREAAQPSATAGVVVSLENGQVGLDLRQETEDGAPVQDRAGADLVVGADTAATVPEGPDHAFLGEPGSKVWILDGQQAGAAAPHWDTTGVPAEQLAEDSVEWALTGIEGPGDLKVFRTPQAGTETEAGAQAPKVLFDSTDGLPDAQALRAADRGEVAWAFTRPGEYRITSRATAHLTTGRTTTADTEWTVRVEESAPQDTVAPPPLSQPPVPASPDEPDGGAATTRTPKVPLQVPAAKAADAIQTQKVVIDDGHVDAVAGKMVDGKLRTLFKDSRNPANIVWREPSSVVLHVDQDAMEKVPTNSAYSFLGQAGSDFWLIPQVQKQSVVWAGWNTEELDSGDLKGPLDMKLTKVSGPGSLAIWETAGLGGAKVLYNTKDGLPDTQKVNLGVHAHGNWGFSKEGTYKVTFQFSGTLANGQAASDTRTYTFAVGDVDPNTVNPGGGTGDGGSTGGNGTGGSATGGSGSTGGSTGGSGSGGTTGGGSAPDGTSGDGSLAHTGSGSALSLTAGAGALVAAGGGALAVGRARRRPVPVRTDTGPQS